MSLTDRYFCRIMTLLTFPRKPLGLKERLMVEESLENPIGLQAKTLQQDGYRRCKIVWRCCAVTFRISQVKRQS